MTREFVHDLQRCGFTIYETGGGLTAWRADLVSGGYVLLTNDSLSHEIEDGETIIVGIYNRDDDPIIATEIDPD